MKASLKTVLGLAGIGLLGWLISATSPLFHWLWFDWFYRHPVGTIWIVAIVASCIFAMARADSEGSHRAWFIPLVLIAALVFYGIWAGALTHYYLVKDLSPTMMSELPTTTEIRYLPMAVAEKYGANRTQDPVYKLGDFDPLDTGTELAWVAPRIPSGLGKQLSGPNDGFAVVHNDGSVKFIRQSMQIGEGLFFNKWINWQIWRRVSYWVEVPEVYYILDPKTEEVLGVAPYLRYRFQFPIRVPEWGGVAVFHEDGRLENLTPQQAIEDSRFVGQRLYPEKLVLLISKSWAVRSGIWNYWFFHKDQVEVPKIENSENQMPYLLPTETGPKWFVAAEPYGPAFGIYKVFWFDAHSGGLNLYELPVDSSLIGPNKALGYVRAAFPMYSWYTSSEKTSSGNIVAIEPRPFVSTDHKLYWMITVTTTDSAGISNTSLVDAQDSSVRYFNSLAELIEFQAGRTQGRMPSNASQQALPQSSVGTSTTTVDTSKLSDRELIELMRQIAEELARRQK